MFHVKHGPKPRIQGHLSQLSGLARILKLRAAHAAQVARTSGLGFQVVLACAKRCRIVRLQIRPSLLSPYCLKKRGRPELLSLLTQLGVIIDF